MIRTVEPRAVPIAEPAEPRTAEEIRAWLIQRVAAELKMQEHEVDPSRPFNDFGVDSLVGTALAKHLSDWLKVELQSTLLWEYPTIASLAEYLARLPSSVRAPAADEIDTWMETLVRDKITA